MDINKIEKNNAELVENTGYRKKPFENLTLIFFLITLLMIIIPGILRICQFIIALINFLSVKSIFYLLSMIGILPNFIFLTIYCILFSKGNIKEWIMAAVFGLIFFYDCACYFFYFYENIKHIFILVLLIINDIIILPIFLFSLSYLFEGCCERS